MSKKAHFRTNVLLKSIIGKDLITDDNVAILELVKNSFDANSKKVEVIFENILNNDDSKITEFPSAFSSKILIKDTGIGMSEADINDKWLNIAYSEKKDKKEEFGRTLAGNKGVGRFSCDRLGQFVDIYTRKSGGDFIHLFIDWRKFEVENEKDLDIQSVELDIETITQEEFISLTGFDDFKKGTILEISKLREHWGAQKILSLRRQLEKLINPNQAFRKNAFNIEIKAEEFEVDDADKEDFKRINGLVKNKVFEKLNFKTSSIESSINEDGSLITTSLQDRGRNIFTLVEKNSFKLLKNINVAVYYLNTYSKMYFTRQTGIRSVGFGSISLFINGFRIPPYGDEGDDWLGLEIRKGQGFNRFLGTREIVGRIEIRDTTDQFKIVSSRTGVVNNEPFNQLTKSVSPFGYFYRTFRRLERFVVEGINWDSVTKSEAKRIEGLIESDTWDETSEVYIEDQNSRDKRILEVINKILDVRKDEVVELTINNDFVKEILDQETQRANEEIEDIISEVANKKMNSAQLSTLVTKLGIQKKDLSDLTRIVSPYTNGTLSKNAKKLENLVTLSHEKFTELEILNKKLLEAEEREKKLQIELELEKDKNTYLVSSSRYLSEDAKGLIHNIKISTNAINSTVVTLIEKVNSGDLRAKEILKRLEDIKFNSEKALKISKLITRSNFKTEATNQVVDIVKYITQYIDIYSDIFEGTQLKFEISTNNCSLIKKISILELSLILDDLISNSEKAGAKKILIEFFKIKESLSIFFSDSGKGIEDKFLRNIEQIFELGVTTTDGSGIGLHSVRKALQRIKGTIDFVGNGVKLKGATFEIKIK